MEEITKGKRPFAEYSLLYLALVLFSCTSICSKLASGQPFLSWEFILFYGGTILILGIYAVLWQMVLKRFPLSTAYANRPVSTLLSMVWGIVLFHEKLTWNMVLGAAVILIGIRMAVTDHED